MTAANARDNDQVFWVQGSSLDNNPRHTRLCLDFTPDGHGELRNGDQARFTVMHVQILDYENADADMTGFGLWDGAVNNQSVIFNDRAEANNFVGVDSQHFSIKVTDPPLLPRHITNKSGQQATGHYVQPNGNHRRYTNQNLMRATFLGNQAINGPKRLWFEPDQHNNQQAIAIRNSRFLQPW